MQLRHLRYFVKIVEAGSLSRAAALIPVAQPALSQQMAELEDELGVTLLHRSARGVRLRMLVDRLFNEAGITPRIAAESDLFSGVLAAVHAGIGDTVMPLGDFSRVPGFVAYSGGARIASEELRMLHRQYTLRIELELWVAFLVERVRGDGIGRATPALVGRHEYR